MLLEMLQLSASRTLHSIEDFATPPDVDDAAVSLSLN